MNEPRLIVALHGLGLSARSFRGLSAHLRQRDAGFDLRAIDLPGFGTRAGSEPQAAFGTAETVIAHTAPIDRPWLLLGHSMGGKVAAALVTLLSERRARLPAGVVLLAPSPPTPEPMPSTTRDEMLGWADSGQIGAGEAAVFLDRNTGSELPADVRERAEEDIRRSSPRAWAHWLCHGSTEDLSDRVDTAGIRALVCAGDADGDLGAAAQPALLDGVYEDSAFVNLPGAGHMLHLERPAEVANSIVAFASEITQTQPGEMVAQPNTTAREPWT